MSKSKCINCKHYKNCDIEDCEKRYGNHGNCHDEKNDFEISEKYAGKPDESNECNFFKATK